MAQTATVVKSLAVGGRTFSKSVTVNGDAGLVVEPSGGVEAALTGLTWTKTDNDTGTVTLSGGHGIATSDVIDVYWSGGARYGLVATTTVNSVVLDGGTGDNFPATSTQVYVKEAHSEVCSIDGSTLTAFYLYSAVAGRIRFMTGASESLGTTLAAGGTYAWVSGDGVTNPLAAFTAITAVTFSHGNTAAQNQIMALQYA